MECVCLDPKTANGGHHAYRSLLAQHIVYCVVVADEILLLNQYTDWQGWRYGVKIPPSIEELLQAGKLMPILKQLVCCILLIEWLYAATSGSLTLTLILTFSSI